MSVWTTGFTAFYSQENGNSSEKSFAIVESRLHQLVEESQGDSNLLKALQGLNQFHAAASREINSLPTTTRSEAKVKTILFADAVSTRLTPLFKLLQIRSIEAETEEKRLEGLLSSVIFLGFLLNVLISFLLVHSFSKRVSSRIDVLFEQVGCLSQNQPIETKLGGNDEIAELERNLLSLSKELELARRRKQDFLAIISHDLRSPLMSLDIMLELFENGLNGPMSTETKRGITHHSRSVNRLVEFISDLLDLEKIDAGSFELLKSEGDVQESLERLVEALSISTRNKNKHVELVETDSNTNVNADFDRLEKALSRIILACLESTAGPVRVRFETPSRAESIRLTIETELGPGHEVIPDKVFDRLAVDSNNAVLFFEHRHSMALARELVRLHGGEIELQLLPNKARFRVTLTRDEDRA
jgi:signal transduction histidine kinase